MADLHVDDAIDRAVRDMASVEPDARLRARVLTAIEQPRPRAFGWPYVVAAGAVAILIVMVTMRTPERAPVEQALAPRSAPAVVERPIAPTPGAGVAEAVTRPARRVAPGRREPSTVAPAGGLPETIPALAEIHPLVTRPPQTPTGDIDPDAIVIAPMGDLPGIAEPPGGRDERPR